MRFVHLTDIHYSPKIELFDFQTMLAALIDELKKEHNKKKIDLIFITGDLIDRGGGDSEEANPFEEMRENVINPIMSALSLSRDQVVFIPGNHDICERDDADTYFLKGLRVDANEHSIPVVNKLITGNLAKFDNKSLKGLERFKKFERKFYKKPGSHVKIEHSNFETTFIHTINGIRIGIAAFNSAWSCDSALDKGPCRLVFGTGQIHRATSKFKKAKTHFNIALIHHPFNAGHFSDAEELEIKSYLTRGDFGVVLCGHIHESKNTYAEEGGESQYYMMVTKAGLNDPRSEEDRYKAGFSVLDLSYQSKGKIKIARHMRKFYQPARFDLDMELGIQGCIFRTVSCSAEFATWLKRYHNDFDITRKAFIRTMSSLASEYVNGPSPDTISKALNESLERFLPPGSEFDYVRKNLSIHWKIKYIDQQYCQITEIQKFVVVTDSSIELKHAVYFDRIEGMDDRSDVQFLSYKVDGKEIKDKAKIKVEREETAPGEPAKEKKTISLVAPLEGKRNYSIESHILAMHPLANAQARIFRRKSFVDGYKITIEDTDDKFRVQVIGVGNDFYDSNVKWDGTRDKKLVIDHATEVLAPGMEFWLLINL